MPRPRLEVLVLVVMMAVFAVAFGLTYTFLNRAEIYPRVISGIGMLLVGFELITFVYQTYRRRAELPPVRNEAALFLEEVRGILPYLAWLLFYFLLIYLVGLIIASGLFTLLFLLVLGRMRWQHALLGGVGIGVAAFLITDLLTLALPSALFDPFIEYRRILRLPF